MLKAWKQRKELRAQVNGLPVEAENAEPLPDAIRECVAVGRGLLAEMFDNKSGESRVLAHSGWARLPEQHPVARLFALLWHERDDARRFAALALAGGDRTRVYQPDYGHFAGSFIRGVHSLAPTMPPDPHARYCVIVAALRAMLDGSASELRAMSNMSYSFLSSALYVALFATCRDTIEAARRLRVAEAHTELCRLLWNLTRLAPSVRISGQDLETLASLAGRALAALPPDNIPDFWHGLTHSTLPRRLAVVPALAHFYNWRAVPALLSALDGQPITVSEPIVAALGRIGDNRALPVLLKLTESKNRVLRAQAQTSIGQIERAEKLGASQTLLRASGDQDAISEDLLRPAPSGRPDDPPHELLRSMPQEGDNEE